jgi:ribonucleotide reductase beta subunit family protein with ferritin-like domain
MTSLTLLAHQESPKTARHPFPTFIPPYTQKSTHNHPPPQSHFHIIIIIIIMLLEHVVTYQAFCEITNFICDNGNDWEEFRTNTTRATTTRKAKKMPPSRRKASKHKIAKTKAPLAPMPLLQKNPHHFVLFPIQHNDIWRMYKKAKASFWTAKEINLSADAADLTSHQWSSTSFPMSWLSLQHPMVTEVTSPEARCFYGFQIAVKNIHSKTYSLLIDTYVKDPVKKMHLLKVIETVPCVQWKAQWALRWCDSTAASFAERMITFAAVEGIFFLGSFCAIFWLKKRGLMLGLCFSNELISRDKGLHCDFACLLYLKLINWLPDSRIVEIMSSAVKF